MMVLTSWLFIGIVFSDRTAKRSTRSWWKGFAITLGLSLAVGIIYWLWHANGLARMARHSANTMEQVLSQVGRFEDLYHAFTLSCSCW